jgi:TonB family protein
MSSCRTSPYAQTLSALLLGLVLITSVQHAEAAAQQTRASTGECESTTPASHPTLISEMTVSKPPVDAVSPPRLLYAVNPDFPTGNSDRDFPANAIVALLVDVDGRPQQVHVSRSLGADFDASALKAINQFRFEPARLKGKLVPAKVCVELNFRR